MFDSFLTCFFCQHPMSHVCFGCDFFPLLVALGFSVDVSASGPDGKIKAPEFGWSISFPKILPPPVVVPSTQPPL